MKVRFTCRADRGLKDRSSFYSNRIVNLFKFRLSRPVYIRLKYGRTAVVVIPKFIKKTARKDIQQQQHCRHIMPLQTPQTRQTIRGVMHAVLSVCLCLGVYAICQPLG